MKFKRNIALTVICIILGIMIAWQYKSINYNQSVASIQNKRTEELVAELLKYQKSNQDLNDRLQQLKEDNRALENEKVGSNAVAQQFKEMLEDVRTFAGYTDVKGRGVVVTLENNDFIPVYGDDLMDVVNELRAAGAQAISISDRTNEERVVAMTEIRDTENYIVINGVRMNPPFKIKAISDPDQLSNALSMIGGILEKLEGIIKVNLTKSDNIVIPKIRDDATSFRTNLLTPVQ